MGRNQSSTRILELDAVTPTDRRKGAFDPVESQIIAHSVRAKSEGLSRLIMFCECVRRFFLPA